MLLYIDVTSAPSTLNSDILKVAAKYIEGPQWKDALKILKLVVTRSSTLAAPPAYSTSGYSSIMSGSSYSSLAPDCISIASSTSFAESEFSIKRELPGRTMEFTFDLTQTPIVGRRYLINKEETSQETSENISKTIEEKLDNNPSPRRSLSHNCYSYNDTNVNWRKPWLSQTRTRERLISLLTSCGQRVGLPKSPSVIFSQNSDIGEKQSSMASSTEELSAANNDASADSKLEDGTQGEFTLFKDFDFLEYELESQEGESMDNFNWGVRRRSLLNLEEEEEEEEV